MDFRKSQDALDLTGEWSYAFSLEPLAAEPKSAGGLEACGLTVRPCRVPGNFELDLQASGLIEDPFHGTNISQVRQFEAAHIWYFRRFTAEPKPDCDAELLFGGLDCFADVYLDGQLVGSTENMLVEHAFPVGRVLREENELLVHIRPAVEEAKRYDYPPLLGAQDLNHEGLYVRKAPHMFGWDIMPRAVSAGIWRPVKLRFLSRERLESVFLETTHIAGDGSYAQLFLRYRARTQGTAADCYEVELTGECDGSRFSQRRAISFGIGHLGFAVSRPKLWWPKGRGEQNLYHVEARLIKNGDEVDAVAFTHGIRTIALDRTSVTGPAGEGDFCFRVNGERVFVKGTNWVPADAFHSRDVSRIPQMLEMADNLGCNMIRCWGGNVYEDDLFYEICDQRGIMIWQDFAMACAIYPQDDQFCRQLEAEARTVARRLRQHPCIALWAGDNECDQAYSWFGRQLDPNTNRLTREVLPRVLREEDPGRPYLPSSPYIDPAAFKAGQTYLPENHLWGPRDYYKSAYYRESLCHFASEIGYHGCPSPESVARFISPEKLWPYQDNEEWIAHATTYSYRIELMAKQIRELFGVVPDNLDDFAFASQASQAEAKKFFIELFRSSKWRRTGIIWWNLIDGWPQFSDAVVDYYFSRKLAYDFIKRSQQSLCLVLKEPENWGQAVAACNDTRDDVEVAYAIRDIGTGAAVAEGRGVASADHVTVLGRVPFSMGEKRFYVIEWRTDSGTGRNHYLAGNPPFDLEQYRRWLEKAGMLPER